MFKAYGEFVGNTGNHPGFRFDRLDQEIRIARCLFDEKWRGLARDALVGGSGLHRISGSSYATESKNVRNQTPLCDP